MSFSKPAPKKALNLKAQIFDDSSLLATWINTLFFQLIHTLKLLNTLILSTDFKRLDRLAKSEDRTSDFLKELKSIFDHLNQFIQTIAPAFPEEMKHIEKLLKNENRQLDKKIGIDSKDETLLFTDTLINEMTQIKTNNTKILTMEIETLNPAKFSASSLSTIYKSFHARIWNDLAMSVSLIILQIDKDNIKKFLHAQTKSFLSSIKYELATIYELPVEEKLRYKRTILQHLTVELESFLTEHFNHTWPQKRPHKKRNLLAGIGLLSLTSPEEKASKPKEEKKSEIHQHPAKKSSR